MKLWTFGDSFSCNFYSDFYYVKKYTEFKGYVPKIYSEIISDEFNCELKNFAICGDNNYNIFHTFINQIDNIKNDDIVIIQFSSVYRYRLIDKNDEFSSVAAYWDGGYDKFNESKDSIIEIGLNRMSEKYKEEIDDWIRIAKLLLKNNKLIFWSPFNESTGNPNMLPYYKLSDITTETNNKVNDHHYGEDGHKDISNFILKTLSNKKTLL